MTAKMEPFPAINSNPVLSVEKDGVILFSNEAGEPLLNEWKVRVGEKLPPHIEIFVQRAISSEGIEKIEVKVGKRVYFVVFHPLPEKNCVNIYGFDISGRKKYEEKFQESATQEKVNLDLASIIDTKAVQFLMNDFYRLAHIPMALLDLKGNILVSVGWQEICTRFHRANPEACKHCVESDINLSKGVAPGGYKLYKCKNNMWDVVTPIVVEGQHIGNIFSGQFLFDNEPLDYELFRSQARKYGFNEEEYIAALEKVPRLSREAVDTSMAFFMTFANMISQLSYSNIKLSKLLAERDSLVAALQDSDERFRSVLENSLDSAYRMDLQSKCFDYMSPVVKQITGFSPEEINAMSINDYLDRIHPDDRPMVISGVAQSLEEGFGAHEYRFKCKDGKYRWLADHFSIIKDKTGMSRFRAGIVRDITERKRVEEELRENERRLHQAQEFLEAVTKGTDVIIAAIDTNFCYTYFNKAYREEIKRLSGRDIHVGSSMIETFAHLPEQQKIIIKQWSDVLEGKSTDKTLALGAPELYQRIYEILHTPIRDTEGKIVGAGEVAYDVTEKVIAEEALRESEERFRALVTTSSEVVYRVSPDWKEMRQLYGRGFLLNTESPNSTWLQEYVPPEDQPHVEAAVDEAIRMKSTYELEHRVRKADGSLGWIFSRAVPLLDANGEIVEWFGAASDITERKRVEEALRKSEERLRLLSDNLPDSAVYQYILEPDGSTRFVYFSAGIEKLNGIKVSDVLRDPGTLHRQISRECLERLVESEARSARELSDFDMELPMRLPDGQIKWMRLHSRPRRLPDGRTIWDGVQTDVTKLKQAEEVLRESESRRKVSEAVDAERRRFLDVLETLPVMLALLTPDHYVAFANRRFREKFGKSGDRHCFEYCFGRTRPCEFCEAYKVLETGQPHHWEVTTPEGSVIDVYDFPFTDVDGSPMVLEMDVDITDRKRSEEKLRDSEEKYRNIVETANEGIIITDNKAIITYVNQKLVDMLGYNLENFIGSPIWGFISEEYRPIVKQNLEKRMQGISGSYELKLIRKDGSPLWIFLNAKPLLSKDGKYVGAMSMLTDITERKKAEEALANLETARKKEIHHRIKNNLQVISSLLDLQAEQFRNRENIKDSEVLAAFKESQDRVISMALIHEELYRGDGFETLNFSPYIQELADTLFQTYRLGSADISLHVDLEENILLDMDTAVPLGIIVNELVSNSLKHAFSGRKKGEIRIKLSREDKEECMKNIIDKCKGTNFTLTVSDNGVGVPENLDIENLDSLGFQLVASLVDQLEGKFELKRNNGTEFIMKFTAEEKDNLAQVGLNSQEN